RVAFAAGADWLDFPTEDFTIMDAGGKVALGRSHYSVEYASDRAILHGENRYQNGDYDIERAVLIPQPGGLDVPARVVEFSHHYFNPGGALLRSGTADFTTGYAVCRSVTPSHNEDQALMLSIPPNTWSGASVAIPLRHMAGGGSGSYHLHVFACAPGPKIMDVDVSIGNETKLWHAGNVEGIKADLTPDFGLFSVFAEPFAPKIHFWFDPTDRMNLEGALLPRYYRGPEIMLVKPGDPASPGPGKP
ncbi:MAG TPA: hypothetical protein VMT58_09480, partial [Candidatus Binataceae bacterium]|nr:hypothetical protein [Candidatus Binataceae bacterium]